MTIIEFSLVCKKAWHLYRCQIWTNKRNRKKPPEFGQLPIGTKQNPMLGNLEDKSHQQTVVVVLQTID